MLQTPVTSAPNDFRDLHGERADAARRAVDQHPLPRPHLALIANGGQGGQRGIADRGGLLEREVGRLRKEVVLGGARVFGERALAPAEHIIASTKLLDVPADRLNLPGHIESRYLAPRLEQPDRRAHGVGDPLQEVPVADIDGRCAHADQHLIVLDDRLGDLLEPQDVG